MVKKKKDALMKAPRKKVIADVVLKATSVQQEGMTGYENITEAIEAYTGSAVVAPTHGYSVVNPMGDDGKEIVLGDGSGLPFDNTPESAAVIITGQGEVASGDIQDIQEALDFLGEDDDDYTPDDVNIPCDAARTAILNASRAIAEINFRRLVRQMALASIYGGSSGTIAKYRAALAKLGQEIESGIVAGEHEFLQGKVAEAQVKASLVSNKLGPRATVIASVIGDRTRAYITNATNQQDTLARNATLETNAAISSASDTERIRASYNNYLATLAQIDGQFNRGVGAIIAACVSQTGTPGISYVSVT